MAGGLCISQNVRACKGRLTTLQVGGNWCSKPGKPQSSGLLSPSAAISLEVWVHGWGKGAAPAWAAHLWSACALPLLCAGTTGTKNRIPVFRSCSASRAAGGEPRQRGDVPQRQCMQLTGATHPARVAEVMRRALCQFRSTVELILLDKALIVRGSALNMSASAARVKSETAEQVTYRVGGTSFSATRNTFPAAFGTPVEPKARSLKATRRR